MKNSAAVALGKKGGKATWKNPQAAKKIVNKNLAKARLKRWQSKGKKQ